MMFNRKTLGKGKGKGFWVSPTILMVGSFQLGTPTHPNYISSIVESHAVAVVWRANYDDATFR